ncbi:MAG: hypothetical protein KJ838_01655 [Candidatus Omnitrophica bacterium]|nr:hypothetical protein [Candidatus Omnitrophota bacterium]
MSASDLKKQIRLLVRLQSADTQVYSLEKEKENIPIHLKEQDEEFARKKDNLAQLEKKGLDLQKKKKEIELDIASKEEESCKKQNQLYQLKTNKEYTAKLKEIETAKADISSFEDKILVLFDEIDKFKKEKEKEKQFLVQEEEKNKEEKAKIDLRKKEIEDRLAQFRSQRTQSAEQIDQEILSKYERIVNSRDHLAIVKVADNACQGCFMQVSPQVINLIRMYDNLVVCETCQRILYIEDESSAF